MRPAVPLAPSQQRLWFLQRLQPEGTAYSVSRALDMRGRLAPRVLEDAFGEVMRRHEALRTRFVERGGRPWQEVAEPGRFRVRRTDLSALSAADRERTVERTRGLELARPFDLERGPLVRLSVLRLAPEHHVLLLSLHHLVMDAWSLGLMLREAETLMKTFSAGRPSPLDEPARQYRDYATRQWQRLKGGRMDEELAYWRERLEGAPATLDLPTDRRRPAVQGFTGGRVPVRLDAATVAAVEELANQRRATPFIVLLAVYAVLLACYARATELVIGTAVTDRPGEFEDVLGFFVNSLPLCVDLGGDPTFRQLVDRVRESVLAALSHRELPFEVLVERLRPQRDASRNPIFQAMFTLQNAPIPELEAGGARLTTLPPRSVTSILDLSAELAPEDGGYKGSFEYNADLFDRETVERMTAAFATLAAAAVRSPRLRLSALPLADGEEEREVASPATTAPAPRHVSLPAAFAAAAAERSDAVAAQCDGNHLTYGALAERAARLAARLRRLGAGPDRVVAVRMERSVEQVAALVGVSMAGAAYLPLDPGHPPQRLAELIADAGARLLVSDGEPPPPLAELATVMRTAAAADDDGGPPGDAPGGATLAYVIYTSGSTGRPKGVLVTHDDVLSLLAAAEPLFEPGPDDAWSLFHSFAFDFSVWEMWAALLYGGRVVVVPYWKSRDPRETRRLLAAERITRLSQTPSAFYSLVHADAAAGDPLASLRDVVFGGESLEVGHLRIWRERYGDHRPRLVNMYGITETTVHVTYAPLTGDELDGERAGSPIGEPLPHLSVQVFDDAFRPVPAGMPGELHVGGAGLARGYLGRPALTAERFVPDPRSRRPGERLYRTGDLARRRPGGGLEYLRRVDRQVQIRGFRIEPAEVEAALAACPGVRQAVVLPRTSPSRSLHLVAWVVADGAGPDVIREHLAERLPAPSLPADLVMLPAMPLNASGKVDRHALPEPEAGPAGGEPLRGTVEEELGEIWSELLEVESVGALDDFFALGGHSLLVVRMLAGIRERFGVDLRVRRAFEARDLRALARAVVETQAEEMDDELLEALVAEIEDRSEARP